MSLNGVSTSAAGCKGKVAFQTPQLAFRALTRNHRRRDDRQSYRCCYCGQFHIGGRLEKDRDDG